MTIDDMAYQLTAYEKWGCVDRNDYIDLYIKEELDTDDISVYEYNEYLINNGYEPYEYMDSFNDLHFGMKPMELALLIHFGDFNPNDDFFQYNGYGNLESFDEYDVRKELEDDTDFLKWYIEENNLIDEDEVEETIKKCYELLRKGY